jgi:hypothetical protein
LDDFSDLEAIAKHTRKSVQSLPQSVRNIVEPETVPVAINMAVFTLP